MARQARSERIYPRKLADGTMRYDITLDFIDGLTGRRVQRRRTFKSEREAKDALARHRVDANAGKRVAPAQETLGTLAADWLRQQALRVKATTMVGYGNQVRHHILPYLADVKLAQLTARRVEQHYAILHDAGVGDVTIRLVHRRLVQLLGYAVRLRLLDINVARDVPLPGYTPTAIAVKREQIWDDAQVARFVAGTRDSYYGPLWHVALATGMRRGELLGLRWQDVDERAGKLYVRQNRAYVRSKYTTSTTKGGSERAITVDADTLAALRAQRIKQNAWRLALGAWPEHDLVFTTSTGTTPHPHYLYQNLRIWQKRLALPRIRMHDLRHTHASMLLRHGRQVKEVSERLGHASAAMTYRVYAHALPEDHAATAQLLGRLLAGE